MKKSQKSSGYIPRRIAIFIMVVTTAFLLTTAGSDAAVFSFTDIANGLREIGSDRPNLQPLGSERARPLSPALACAPQPSGMVGWWPANGNADDVVGGNHGTLSGTAAYAAGKVDQAFSLDGAAGSHVAVPDAASHLLNNTAGTITVWVNPTAVGDNDIVAAFGTGNNGEGLGIGVWNNVRIYHHTSTYDWQSNTPISSNTWTFIAYTWDSTTERIYKDGVLSESRPRNFNYVPGAARIGDGFWNDPANRFPGLIDELAIFNRTLDAAEVTAIYNAGTAGICVAACAPPPPNMVAWWPGEGNTNDIQGPTFENGTLMGTAAYSSGMVGQSFSFDGDQSGFVEIPDTAVFNPNGGFTVDGWFYIDPAAPGNLNEIATLVGKSEGSTGNGWTLYFDDRGIGGQYKALKFSVGGIIVADNAIPSAGWYHIAGTWDPVAIPRSTIYVNGNDVVDSGAAEWNILHNNLNVRIGAMHWTDFYGQGNDRLNGKADEVEFLSRALSQSEVQAIYNAGSAGKCREFECTPPPQQMVSWWPGDGNALDIQGPTFENGTLMNGATFAPGKVGQAFSFDGIDDHVIVPDSPSLDFTTEISVEAWIYRNDSGHRGLLNKGPIPSNGVYDLAIFQDKFYFRLNGADLNLPSVASIPVGAWTHVAGTYDGLVAKIYINGALNASFSYSQPISTNDSPLHIGLYGTPAVYFNGMIDELELFGRALSETEVQAVYNAGSAGKCREFECTPPPPNMIGWWPGDGSAVDIKGPNNGTLMNGATFGVGKVGQAFSLDGVNDFVDLGNSTLFDFADFTLDAWVYTEPSTNIGEQRLISRDDWTTEGGDGREYYFIKSSSPINCGVSNRPQFAINVGGITSICSPNDLAAGWHHIAATRQGNTVALYVDGELVASATSAATGIISPEAPLVVGAISGVQSIENFLGLVDEVEVFNTALSQNEVQAIYSAGSAGKCRECAPLPELTNSWWRAEDNAEDSVGENDGQMMNGATFADGKVGRSFDLDGIDDVVRVPDAPNLSFAPTEPVTIYMWANPTALNAMHLMGKRGTCSDSGQSANYQIYYDAGGGISLNVGGVVLATGTHLTTNIWQHVAFAFDGTTLRLYLNGQEIGSLAGTLGPETTAPLLIGGACDGVGAPFPGRLDEVTIAGNALSGPEIQAIYNAGSAGTCPIGPTPTPTPTPTATPTYTVTYDGNGYTGGTPPVDGNSPYHAGALVGVLGPGDLVNTGFVFGGWNTAADGSGTQYNPAQAFLLNAATVLYAQWIVPPCEPAGLDLSFGSGGKVVTDMQMSSDEANAMAVQPDGKIVAAGFSFTGPNRNFAVVRYNNDGSLDTTFGGTGKVMTSVGTGSSTGNSIAIQPDGKIVVAGYALGNLQNDFAVVRYNGDGSLDTSFDGDGKVTTDMGGVDEGESVALQADGKIVVAGWASNDFALVRYNADGSLDSSFGAGGMVLTDFYASTDEIHSVAIQPDGKIVAAGQALVNFINDFAVARYTSDGALDTSFGGDGKVTTDLGGGADQGRSVALQADGKIVVAGWASNDFALVRYDADGSLDSSFGSGGMVLTDFFGSIDQAHSVAIQPDGKIVAAGQALVNFINDFAVARYNSDGELDTSFDGDGKVTTPVLSSEDVAYSAAIQPDGKIVAAGYSNNGSNHDFALVRYGAPCASPTPTETPTATPTATPTPGSISGTISYAIVAKPVPGVLLSAAGTPDTSGTSDGSGNYMLADLGPGPYTVTPSRATQPCGSTNGIFSLDAAKVAQFVVGLRTFTDNEMEAAMVGGLGFVSSFDAALIARRVVGLCTNPANLGGQWVFTPSGRNYPDVPGDITGENYTAIMMGDVDGDWIPPGAGRPAGVANDPDSVQASLPKIVTQPGSVVDVPLALGKLKGVGVEAYQFDIEYDPAVMEPTDIAAHVTGTISEGLSTVSNVPVPGLLKVAVFGARAASGDGTYVNLRFTAKGAQGTSSPLAIRGFVLNDGTTPVVTVDGGIMVTASAGGVIAGRAIAADGTGIRNAQMVLTGNALETPLRVTTGSFGYYNFDNLTLGETYVVTINSRRYTFRTPSRVISLVENAADMDFIAEP